MYFSRGISQHSAQKLQVVVVLIIIEIHRVIINPFFNLHEVTNQFKVKNTY